MISCNRCCGDWIFPVIGSTCKSPNLPRPNANIIFYFRMYSKLSGLIGGILNVDEEKMKKAPQVPSCILTMYVLFSTLGLYKFSFEVQPLLPPRIHIHVHRIFAGKI